MFDRETVNLFSNTSASTFWMHGRTIRFTGLLPHILFSGNICDSLRPIHILHNRAGNPFSFPVVSNTLRDELFLETAQGDERGRLPHEPHSSCVPADEPESPAHSTVNRKTFAVIDQRDTIHEVLSAGSKYSQATFQ
jgi:hypothetical protein